MNNAAGFTIVELLITVTVIIILATMVVFVPGTLIAESQDRERGDDITSIARRLEQAYNAQETGAPAYPTTTKLLADISSANGTVARLSAESVKAPSATASSVVAATTNSTTEPKGAGSPVLGEYVYQPLTSADALCTGTSICVKFFFYYRQEEDNTVKIVRSIRQQ